VTLSRSPAGHCWNQKPPVIVGLRGRFRRLASVLSESFLGGGDKLLEKHMRGADSGRNADCSAPARFLGRETALGWRNPFWGGVFGPGEGFCGGRIASIAAERSFGTPTVPADSLVFLWYSIDIVFWIGCECLGAG
jgi:hypothetical protein